MSEAAIEVDDERFFVRGFVMNDGEGAQSRQRLWVRFVSLRPLEGEPTFEASSRGADLGAFTPLDPQPRGETVDAATRILNVPLARDWTAVDVTIAWTSIEPDGRRRKFANLSRALLGAPLNTPQPTPVVIPKPRRRRLSAWLKSSDTIASHATWLPLWQAAAREPEKGELTDPAGLAAKEDAKFAGPLRKLKGVLDDVSIIRTVGPARADVEVQDEHTKEIVKRPAIKDLANPGVVWDPLFEPGLVKHQVRVMGPDGRFKFFQKDARPDYTRAVIRLCHDSGIQVLCGYSLAEEGTEDTPMGNSFLRFLLQPADVIARHAQDVVSFVWDRKGLDFDGIGLDIELVRFGEQHAPGMRAFVGALADALAPRGKLVTFATGVGARTVVDPLPADAPKGAKPVSHLVADPSASPGFGKAQPFDMAKGRANVIARPMAYDIEHDDPKLREWHESIVAWAVPGQVEAAQLQLGVKVVPNTKVASVQTKLGPTTGTLTNKPKALEERCRGFLAARDVGLIVFAVSDLASATPNLVLWNDALNGDDAKVPAGTPGEPIQGPRPAAAKA